MELTYTCECGKSYTVTRARAGAERRCHFCSRLFRFPDFVEDPDEPSTADRGVTVPPAPLPAVQPPAAAPGRQPPEPVFDIPPTTWYTGLHAVGRGLLALVLLAGAEALWVVVPVHAVAAVGTAVVLLLVGLVAGKYDSLSLQAGDGGQPTLRRRRYVGFVCTREATYALNDYHSLGLENDTPRHREVKLGFFLIGGLPGLLASDDGTRTGKWQLSLRADEDDTGVVVFADARLAKVKRVEAAIKRVTGLRVGRPKRNGP
jgi:hypothetical protein